MSDGLIKHFFGGFVRLHILYHAAQESVCGVDMIEELRRHGYELSPGTIYPILHQLESDGFLRCKKQVVEGRLRKNYRITAAGRRLLHDAKSKLRELAGEVIYDQDLRAEIKEPNKHRKS